MMKKLLLLLLAGSAALASCVKNPTPEPETDDVVIVESYLPTKSYSVPVVGDGTVTQVVYHRSDGDREILATTDIPLTIQIPAWLEGPVVRSGESEDYLEILNYARGTIDFEANSAIKESSSVLMFEDSRTGDYDYNDLVLYVKHSIRGNGSVSNPFTITIWVKPIALGSVNKIAFGWEDGNGEHMLSENVRQDFFFGHEGFINTYADKPMIELIPVVKGGGNEVHAGYTIVKDRTTMERQHYEDPTADLVVGGYFKYDPVPTTCTSQSNDAKMVKYFIKTSGCKFYVSSIDKSAPAGTFPYGISMLNAGYHCFERTPIWEAYPGFKSWIETGSPLNWSSNRIKTNTYDKHVNYARW